MLKSQSRSDKSIFDRSRGEVDERRGGGIRVCVRAYIRRLRLKILDALQHLYIYIYILKKDIYIYDIHTFFNLI